MPASLKSLCWKLREIWNALLRHTSQVFLLIPQPRKSLGCRISNPAPGGHYTALNDIFMVIFIGKVFNFCCDTLRSTVDTRLQNWSCLRHLLIPGVVFLELVPSRKTSARHPSKQRAPSTRFEHPDLHTFNKRQHDNFNLHSMSLELLCTVTVLDKQREQHMIFNPFFCNSHQTLLNSSKKIPSK